MTEELYKKYRPTTFKAMVGSKAAVSQCLNWTQKGKAPHCILFQGPSGCGKTTLARILKKKLCCGDADFQEINAAGQARGIERIKQIESQIRMAAIAGDCRIYLIDEAHKLTNDAQNAILKMLEDTPAHVYFMLCTTDPQKLIATIRTRATAVTVSPLTQAESLQLIKSVCDKEGITCSEPVAEAIADAADGSARKVLVLLNQIIGMEEDAQLEMISKEDAQRTAKELCQKLMNPRSNWKDVAPILKSLDEDAESFRWMMLGYASAVALSGGKMANRAFVILDQFAGNYFDSKKAGLIADCWEVVHGRKDD